MVSGIAKDATAVIFFILGFIMLFSLIFANASWGWSVVYVAVFAVIFIVTGVMIAEFRNIQTGSHRPVSSRSAYFANRAGSARAKRNIWRGHRYSKK
jgi:fatty acid desaturase